MTYEQIRQLITARMVTFTGIAQERIQYPNQPDAFDTPADGLWCRLNIQHATAYMAGMADQPYTRKPGIIVVQCFARLRTGMRGLNELADALEAHFAYWTEGDLECIEASQVDAGEYEGFYQINVNIRFRAG
ncbi:phage tail terminator-like protein [Pseudomonas alliivorans]|nr:phage tail terminator-like protein [Pseudomonas alliivorans]